MKQKIIACKEITNYEKFYDERTEISRKEIKISRNVFLRNNNGSGHKGDFQREYAFLKERARTNLARAKECEDRTERKEYIISAFILFQRVAKLFPEDIFLKAFLAECLLLLDRHSKSLKYTRQILRMIERYFQSNLPRYNDFKVYVISLRVHSLVALRRFAEAEKLVKDALKEIPEDVNLYRHLAEIYYKQGLSLIRGLNRHQGISYLKLAIDICNKVYTLLEVNNYGKSLRHILSDTNRIFNNAERLMVNN